jgi:D-apionate oxidoisomerase
VTHPCHPPMFNDETDPAAQRDWFGGIARQDIVCALYQGPEEHYQECEELARIIYSPVRDSYRITVEQMAILEPALVETFSLCLISAMKEAFDEALKMGVPAEAAKAFFMGHARIEFAICFGYADFKVSDGAKLAMEKAREVIFNPDWKKNVMDLARIRQSVAEITDSLSR